jgi:aryl-alcohol dehydrogenase-like predicted oxidoreductase
MEYTRLGTDYVDLYQIHRFDPDTPAAETMAALHDVVKAGTRGITMAQVALAWVLRHPAVVAPIVGEPSRRSCSGSMLWTGSAETDPGPRHRIAQADFDGQITNGRRT